MRRSSILCLLTILVATHNLLAGIDAASDPVLRLIPGAARKLTFDSALCVLAIGVSLVAWLSRRTAGRDLAGNQDPGDRPPAPRHRPTPTRRPNPRNLRLAPAILPTP